jgi:alkyldihydroxyacetonephosphate synthase
MRRWNGWGSELVEYPLQPATKEYLVSLVGESQPGFQAGFDETAARAPEPRLGPHPLVTFDQKERLRHARGQSLPDWVALRSGQIGAFPDGVAFPTCEMDVQHLLEYARQEGARVIPYGGGTSVVGHINVPHDKGPVLTIDMGRLNRLNRIDATSLLADFGAGIAGPDLEAQLRAKGFTLGHFPQSFEYSTLGGWVATRSSGQQSLRYGRIEKLFAGGRLLAPNGVLDLPPFPASAAGPDLRELALGSEGRLGIFTEVIVRISPLPEKESFHGIFFPAFEDGLNAARQIVQSGIPLSMLRYSSPVETATTLAMAGHENIIGLLEGVLSVRGAGAEKCLLLLGFSGSSAQVRFARGEALAIARKHSGIHVGRNFGDQWHKSRFRTPYLRNTLWEIGYAVDTLETAVRWSKVQEMLSAVDGALRTALVDLGERVHVFSHLSHLYPWGSSIYTTFIFRLSRDPEQCLERWRRLKEAASQAIVENKGTISHQHGVGLDHKSYLQHEKGDSGMAALKQLVSCFDPQGMMNPGKLIDE